MFFKNVDCRPLKKLSSWRRISLSAWSRPADPSVYALLEVDMTKGLSLLERLTKETGAKLTVTHLLIKAVAKTLAKYPEINVLIRRGKLYVRENVDVFVQVFVEEGGRADLSGAKVRNAHEKSLEQIAGELKKQAEKIRTGQDPNLKTTKRSLKILTPRLMKWSIRFLEWLGYDLNISPKFLGLPPDPFGAAMITNVGMFGLKMGWAPLVPFSRTPIVLLAGEITPQSILNIGVTIDHRIIDGFLGGRAAGELKRLLENPDEMV
ncbi:MAG: 2-oxo acid dehydrogenase subunit E2 [Deltaproteobacteria bacterium]|nr:2-oxo acid dehydrogenase subunit E2 [Deltaproteobacteria bacterium]